ncbi:hypothetical protein jhhlp_007881 [Lomentospora prolificans]|uniref:Uncharacterized protein n=1 Tax=Lomentospora prolificans TaxID=41688 RepID=A0A2N3N0U2_9PEZI|nr:hypothetical protein jhhlp_007881 [Lomentospora prolificans]
MNSRTSQASLWVGLLQALAFGTPARATGCDQSDPECCYEAWSSWSSSKIDYETGSPSLYSTAEVVESVPIANPSLTTLCDGFPRLLGPEYEYYTTVTTYDEPSTTWVTSSYITPPPECTIAEADCTPFILDYESSSAEYQTNASAPWPSVHPPCTTYSSCPGEGEGMCKMIVNVDTVYYWPVTATGDLCGDRTTVTNPEPTRTTEISGTVFTSPSVYVVVDQLSPASYAGRYKAKDCGHDLTNRVIAMHPTDVSTHFGPLKRTDQVWRQLNLADLNTPVPATAYFGIETLPDCTASPEACTATMTDDGAYYHLSAPTQQLRDLDPTELAFCDLHPSQRTALGAVWIPLEPTSDDWPGNGPDPTLVPESVSEEPIETDAPLP